MTKTILLALVKFVIILSFAVLGYNLRVFVLMLIPQFLDSAGSIAMIIVFTMFGLIAIRQYGHS
jgi:hypothetical protein